MRIIAPSELIINGDGSIFHLHLKPGQLADTVILVGDPGRVEQVAAYFDSVECRAENREFVAVTGECFGKRMTVQSTGIGTDNIDIVVNELDALANIDFETRTEKAEKTRTASAVYYRPHRLDGGPGLRLCPPGGALFPLRKAGPRSQRAL